MIRAIGINKFRYLYIYQTDINSQVLKYYGNCKTKIEKERND
jgi:hypothetical protein